MSLWSTLTARLTAREPATALALVRILLALAILWDLLDIRLSGAMDMLWMPRTAGGLSYATADGWLAEYVASTPDNILAVYAVTVTACVLLVAGLGARPAAFVTLLGFRFLTSLNGNSIGGHDRVIANGLFLLCLSPSDVTLSARCWLKHRAWTSAEAVAAWPRHLFIYQLALMYTCTGIQKLGLVWWPGGGYLAVYYSLLQVHWARADWWWVAWLAPLTRMGTALTWWWETMWWLVPLWIWLRATPERGGRLRALAARFDLRTPFVIIGILMHGTIWVFLNLGPFSAVTLSLYPALYHPDELHQWAQKIRKRLRG
ncbi:MAG: hypothetical protein ACI8S6_002785 [Myxococcota bacterium]|jgi:hypothetical protein